MGTLQKQRLTCNRLVIIFPAEPQCQVPRCPGSEKKDSIVRNRLHDVFSGVRVFRILLHGADSSVAHHMLGSYQRSLLAILLAQFTKKRFSGGMAGVVRLASTSEPVQVRACACN